MPEPINIRFDDIRPDGNQVAAMQNIPENRLTDKHQELISLALTEFETLATPIGLISNCSIPEFDLIFPGEGENDPSAPLEEITKKADNIALCAVTVGQPVCDKIDQLFGANEFALGSMLDSVASVAVDQAMSFLENHHFCSLPSKYSRDKNKNTLCYSPGYCGWHVTAQRKLFGFLHPEQIGITLRESCLMEPLKSVSGVLITGSKEIHQFDNSFSFCADCPSQPCLDRMKEL